jgi:phosphohistidine phosphatase
VKLLIIRHGPAGDREDWEAKGRDDRLRPLTAKGTGEIQKTAKVLAKLVPQLDLLATSPFTRAVETADIVASRYRCEAQQLDALTPDSAPELLTPWLQQHPARGTVAMVGHEPHLSSLVAYLLTGGRTSFLDLKKGGACLLEVGVAAGPGSATLGWLLTDTLLRRLD